MRQRVVYRRAVLTLLALLLPSALAWSQPMPGTAGFDTLPVYLIKS